MRPRLLAAGLAMLCGLGLSACSTFEAPLDPTLFAASAETDTIPAPGAVSIRMPADGSNLVVTAGGLGGYDANKVRLPVGEVVRAAAQLAFAREFGGGVRTAPPGGTGAADSTSTAPWQVIVEAGAIHFDFRDDFVYVIPLGPLVIERRDVTVRMALAVRVVSEDGAELWSRSYDAGRELWKPRGGRWLPTETSAQGVQRLAHEQAYRLLRRAAHDVRLFVEADRRRERVL